MQRSLLILLCIAIVFGGVFWYETAVMVCDTPIRYRIGTVDPRFDITPEKAIAMARAAEAVWEDPLSTELFIYDEKGDLPINFIFDERQERSNAEEVLRENLEDKEDVSEDVKAQYNELVAKFEVIKKDYEADVDAYETKLAAYNTEVSDWNNRGGAPSDVREDLDARADALKDEQKALEKSAQQLNTLIADINRIGARGNTLVADYNSSVSEYNTRFTESEEFAQGDYTHDAIDIYEFNSDEELTIVLAHELGHALSLSHVDGSSSIMYAHMGKQSLLSGITPEDRTEYVRQCANRGTIPTIVRTVRALFQG